MKSSRSNRLSIYDYEQPFDLFEEFEKGDLRTSSQRVTPSSHSWKKLLIFSLSFVLTVATVFIGIGLYTKPIPHKPFVLLELRAISMNGHPIAGAKVHIKNKEFGVTDSFGEWRRYLKLKPGVSFEVSLQKQGSNGVILTAYKTVKIPRQISPTGDTEIKASLELKPKVEEASPKISPSSAIKARANLKDTASRGREEIPRNTGAPMGMERQDTQHLDQIDIRYNPSQRNYNTLMEAHQSRVLGNRIVPEMVALASEEGLMMSRNASWKYNIHYIPHYGNVGFIKGSVIWLNGQGERQRLSFLRNFAKTIEETADLMIKMVRHHVNRRYRLVRQNDYWVVATYGMPSFWLPKGDLEVIGLNQKRYRLKREPIGLALTMLNSPCTEQDRECTVLSESLAQRPPIKSWKTAQLAMGSPLPQGSEIYVGGFKAFQDKSQSHMWHYWANPGQSQNLTILVDNKIYFRTRFRHHLGKPFVLTIPQTIAKR